MFPRYFALRRFRASQVAKYSFEYIFIYIYDFIYTYLDHMFQKNVRILEMGGSLIFACRGPH